MIFPQVELIASFSFIVTSFFCLQVPPSFAETLLDFNEIVRWGHRYLGGLGMESPTGASDWGEAG